MVLETERLPCADFDGPVLHPPSEPFRIYRTSRGFHLFLVGRLVNSVDEVLPLFCSMGVDEKFIAYCVRFRSFRIRCSPKRKELLDPGEAICTLLGQQGGARPEWSAFLARHDELCLRPGARLLV